MSLMNMNVLSSFDIFLSGKIIKFDDILYHRKNTPLKLKPATKIYMKIINCLHGRCRHVFFKVAKSFHQKRKLRKKIDKEIFQEKFKAQYHFAALPSQATFFS